MSRRVEVSLALPPVEFPRPGRRWIDEAIGPEFSREGEEAVICRDHDRAYTNVKEPGDESGEDGKHVLEVSPGAGEQV